MNRNALLHSQAKLKSIGFLYSLPCCRASVIREKCQLVKRGSVTRERNRALLHYTIFAIRGAVRAYVRGVTRTGHTGHPATIRGLSPRADRGLLRITHCVRREEARCPQATQRLTRGPDHSAGPGMPTGPLRWHGSYTVVQCKEYASFTTQNLRDAV